MGTLEDGRRLTQTFMGNICLDAPTKISGYWPIHSEINVRPLLELLHEKGHTVCLPVVVSHEVPLKFRRWGPCDLLESASFGTFEPAITRPEVDPEVVLVPLLAFDSKGHRLGYGGGYYDRTLESFAERGVVSVGIAYEAQFLEKLPSDTKDVALNWIITEERSRNMRDAREPK